MPKFYYKQPEEHVIIVSNPADKGEYDGGEYQVWKLTPTYMGSVEKVTTARVMCGQHIFPNVGEAARYLLMEAGEENLAETLGYTAESRRRTKKHKIPAADIIAAGHWPEFAKAFKITPNDAKAMMKTYELSLEEVKKFVGGR